MALKGSIETFSLSDLLQFLSNDQKTGVLKLSNGENEVKIFFKDGVIVFASSSEKYYQLGRFLKSKGLVSDNELRSLLNQAKEKKKKLGTVLVESGYISIETLKELLHNQVKEILCNVFLWRTCEFEYTDVPISVDGKLITHMSTTEIVVEAIRRIDELSVIKEQIPESKIVFRTSGEVKDRSDIKIDKNQIAFLALVDGAKTVRELIQESGYDEFTAYKIIYSLFMLDLVEVGPDETTDGIDAEVREILSLYSDIFRTLLNDLNAQLGEKAYAIFEECKGSLKSVQRRLLMGFDPRRRMLHNIQALMEEINLLEGDDNPTDLLVEGLNSLLLCLFEREISTLGSPLTLETIERIGETLDFFRKHGRGVKVGIISIIEKTLEKVGHKVAGERKSSK